MDNSYRPKRAGRYGIMIATSGCVLPATPFTANTTVTHQFPTPPGKLFFQGACAHASVIPADADGTCVIRIIKRRASDDTDVQLTSDFNLEGLTASEKSNLTVSPTVSDAGRIILSADTIEIDLVSDSAAINTQPTSLTVSCEFAYLE